LVDKLKALEDLQRIDVQIAELDRTGSEHPKQLAEIEAQLKTAQAAVDVERARLAELERQKHQLEEQLANDKERVKKWEGRLSEQRSTREYSALAREIDIAKKQNTTTAEEIVSLAKQAEDVRLVIEQRIASHEDLAGQIGGKAAAIRTALEELATRRRTLEEKRAAAAAKVDAAMLRRYDQIKKRRGTAIVPVVGGACRGCNMNVPPQFYNELRATRKIDVCPSCGRMIYAAEAFEDRPANP
jgi:predicted  nucleic acid-binding Zn-ribbon protein